MHGVAEPDTTHAARLPERHAGRVILLDPGDRVLLMRYDDALPNGRHWTTPGGGLDPGEDYAAAAVRELAEETGWTDIPLGPEVLQRSLTMEHGGRLVHQHERHYLARTDQPGRALGDVAAMHAADGIAAWRWWTLAEMDSTTEVIWPAELAQVIRKVLAEERHPGEPSRGIATGRTGLMEPMPEEWNRAVAVVAHPDDLEYGAAAAVARWTSQGKHVAYLLATRGEAGIQGMAPDLVGPLRVEEVWAQRRRGRRARGALPGPRRRAGGIRACPCATTWPPCCARSVPTWSSP